MDNSGSPQAMLAKIEVLTKQVRRLAALSAALSHMSDDLDGDDTTTSHVQVLAHLASECGAGAVAAADDAVDFAEHRISILRSA